MKSFIITNSKIFMQKLLTLETFDAFFLEEAIITTYNSFIIDGHILPEFYSKEDNFDATQTFSSWKQMKSICFDLIKGKNTPLNFKFVLHFHPNDTQLDFPSSQPAYIITIKYDSTSITLTTGTCFSTFSLDKEPEKHWDLFIQQLLLKENIAFEERI